MKRFQFPVERVRLWRHEQAEMEEVKLQRLHADLQRFTTERQNLHNEASREEDALKRGGLIEAEALARLDEFKQYVRARSQTLDEQRRQLEVKIAKQRQALIESRRKAELLNRLKEEALAKWNSAHAKEQEELSSELFLAKRKRR